MLKLSRSFLGRSRSTCLWLLRAVCMHRVAPGLQNARNVLSLVWKASGLGCFDFSCVLGEGGVLKWKWKISGHSRWMEYCISLDGTKAYSRASSKLCELRYVSVIWRSQICAEWNWKCVKQVHESWFRNRSGIRKACMLAILGASPFGMSVGQGRVFEPRVTVAWYDARGLEHLN